MPPARWTRWPPNFRGALWLLASSAGFALMNVLVKTLGNQGLHGFELAFFRCLFGLLALLPFVLPKAPDIFRTGRPGMHLARALAGIGAMTLIFYAVTSLPLATVTAIGFARPLFMIPLGVLFLAEAVHWRRWTATLAGFGGVLLMLAPAWGAFGLPALAAVVSVSLMAVVLVMVKKLTATEQPMTMLFYFTLAATFGSAVPASFVWTWPEPGQWLPLAVMGVLASAAQYFAVRAFRAGEASAITPMDYSQLLFATGLGYVLWGELPDGATLAGAAVVIASTLYILRREARLTAAVSGPASP